MLPTPSSPAKTPSSVPNLWSRRDPPFGPMPFTPVLPKRGFDEWKQQVTNAHGDTQTWARLTLGTRLSGPCSKNTSRCHVTPEREHAISPGILSAASPTKPNRSGRADGFTPNLLMTSSSPSTLYPSLRKNKPQRFDNKNTRGSRKLFEVTNKTFERRDSTAHCQNSLERSCILIYSGRGANYCDRYVGGAESEQRRVKRYIYCSVPPRLHDVHAVPDELAHVLVGRAHHHTQPGRPSPPLKTRPKKRGSRKRGAKNGQQEQNRGRPPTRSTGLAPSAPRRSPAQM